MIDVFIIWIDNRALSSRVTEYEFWDVALSHEQAYEMINTWYRQRVSRRVTGNIFSLDADLPPLVFNQFDQMWYSGPFRVEKRERSYEKNPCP